MMRQLASILATFSRVNLDDNAAQARAVMRLSLMDWCAVGLAGTTERAACIVRGIAQTEGGQGAANILGISGQYPARAAALVNGVTSHALDYDDTHFAHIGHPSVAVIPAALAAAQTYNRSIPDLLDAALIGAEASVRIGLWLGRSHYQSGFHQTATAGAFGACIAVARLAQLSISETEQALAITASRAAGLKAQFGSMAKPYHAGLAAQTGVEAATLAKAGFTAQITALDGPYGFGATHAGEADWSAFEGMGAGWLMTDVSHKFHACCHGTHAMIEALLALGKDLQPDQIASIEIDTHERWLSVCNIAVPTGGLEVKFSLAHIAAMVLHGVDTTSLNSFSDTVARDETLIATAQKALVQSKPDIAETASRVTLISRSGNRRMNVFDLKTPMDFDTRQSKIRAKARTLLGAEKSQDLWQAIGSTESDLSGLQHALFPPKVQPSG